MELIINLISNPLENIGNLLKDIHIHQKKDMSIKKKCLELRKGMDMIVLPKVLGDRELKSLN